MIAFEIQRERLSRGQVRRLPLPEFWSYDVTAHPGGELVFTSRDLPEAITDAAGADLADAIETAIMARIADRKPIPRAKDPGDRPFVTLSLSATIKLAIYRHMIANGWSRLELARRLDCHPMQVGRLLDLNHDTRLSLLERYLDVLGIDVELRA